MAITRLTPTMMPKKTDYVQVSDLSCSGLPTIGIFKQDGSFYLRITFNDQERWTPAAKRSKNPTWDDVLSFDLDTDAADKALLDVQVYARRRVGDNDLVCEMEKPIEVASTPLGNGDHDILWPLYKREKDGQKLKERGTLHFKLRYVLGSAIASDSIPESLLANKADDPIGNLHEPPAIPSNSSELVEGTAAAMNAIQNVYDVWQPLIDRVDAVVKIVDGIAEIHPYARMAWSVLSLPINAVIAQNTKDQAIRDLFETMLDLYNLMSKVEGIKKSGAHRRTVKLIFQQTAECGWFISDYVSRSYVERTVKGITTNISSKITMYCATFQNLKTDLQTEGALVTEIAVFQLSPKVTEILSELKDSVALQYVNEMYCVKNQRQPDPCLPETRQGVIDEITDWLTRPIDDNSNDEPRLYWLSGVAGCGKSAIARSVNDQLEAQRRCASFFFDASRQAREGPDRLFATISRNLAGINEGWKACLVKILKGSMTVRETSSIKRQFEDLFLLPARQLEGTGPILIVIDALDESGSQPSRREVVAMLKRIPELPSRFRFFITSRQSEDFDHAFANQSWVHYKQLHDVDSSSTDKDIRNFVRSRLEDVPGIDHDCIEDWTRRIVVSSNHLFQWAATVCNYIRGDGTVDLTPAEKMDEILMSSYSGLDGLYTMILNQQCRFEPGSLINRRFQNLIGRILLLSEPLPIDSISELWYEEDDRKQLRDMLPRLGSLLAGVSPQDYGHPIYPLHVSFVNYLQSKERSKIFYVETAEQNERLTSALFRVMEESLQFNICNLETSYKRNTDVQDLNTRVAVKIRTHLDYACRYWADHLSRIPSTVEWIDRVDRFLRSRFLFWFEVLSLLKKTSTGLKQLLTLQEWLESEPKTQAVHGLKEFIQDAYRFGANFRHIAEESTPHLYLSALSFVPRNSPVSQTYLSRFPGCISIRDDHKIFWPWTSLSIKVLSPVEAAVLSPDGKKLISAFDNTLMVWNAHTGELVTRSFHGHTGKVTSAGFSLDGTQVVSGSWDNTVRIWHTNTGEPIAGPFRGHTRRVTSVAFSPSGQYVVSGLDDKTLRVWNVRIGEMVVGPLECHD